MPAPLMMPALGTSSGEDVRVTGVSSDAASDDLMRPQSQRRAGAVVAPASRTRHSPHGVEAPMSVCGPRAWARPSPLWKTCRGAVSTSLLATRPYPNGGSWRDSLAFPPNGLPHQPPTKSAGEECPLGNRLHLHVSVLSRVRLPLPRVETPPVGTALVTLRRGSDSRDAARWPCQPYASRSSRHRYEPRTALPLRHPNLTVPSLPLLVTGFIVTV